MPWRKEQLEEHCSPCRTVGECPSHVCTNPILWPYNWTSAQRLRTIDRCWDTHRSLEWRDLPNQDRHTPSTARTFRRKFTGGGGDDDDDDDEDNDPDPEEDQEPQQEEDEEHPHITEGVPLFNVCCHRVTDG